MNRYEAAVTKGNLSEAEKNKLSWLKKYGFNEKGVTYIYFLADSYNIKEQLKADGFKFTKELLWHCPTIPKGYENKVFPLEAYVVADFFLWGGAFLPVAASLVRRNIAERQPKPENPSEWFGNLKDKITDLKVYLVESKEIESRYGLTNLHTFRIAGTDNLLQWWTKTSIYLDHPEDILLLSGIIKDHNEYKGVKTTIVTRCKLRNEVK